MAATQFAADTPPLMAGMIAVSGVFSLWRPWIYALAFLVLGFVLAGRRQRAGVVTDAELTELRYGKAPATVLRGFKAVDLGTVFNRTVLAMVPLASTRIAEPFLVWDRRQPSVGYDPVRSAVGWVGADFTHAGPDDPLGFRDTSAEPREPPPHHPERSEAAEEQVENEEEASDERDEAPRPDDDEEDGGDDHPDETRGEGDGRRDG